MCFLELGFSLFWLLSLIGSTFNSVAGTCCTTVHTKFQGILATFCPHNMSYEVQQVELRATCCGDKISPKLVLHNYKSISSQFSKLNSVRHVAGTKYPPNWCCTIIKVSVHTKGHVAATCPWDMYPQHFHMGANDVILSLLHAPGYTSLLHVASVCTTQVFVPATCRCDMSLQHDPLCLPTLKQIPQKIFHVIDNFQCYRP